jgi:hypothetical protein
MSFNPIELHGAVEAQLGYQLFAVTLHYPLLRQVLQNPCDALPVLAEGISTLFT